jgi:hypothetical protein
MAAVLIGLGFLLALLGIAWLGAVLLRALGAELGNLWRR